MLRSKNLLVLDEGRIQVFTENGEFVRKVKTKEQPNGMLEKAVCVVVL